MINRTPMCSTLLVTVAVVCLTLASLVFVDGLSSSSSPPKRPLVSLTGPGDVSGFLYGKLQRVTSFYGSGLVGPATAIVHGDKDIRDLLPQSVVSNTNKEQLKDLDGILWNQFGMASCEGSVDREDLMTGKSYLKPRLAELQDTFVFLDATTNSMGKTNTGGGSGASGLGGLFSSILPKNDSSRPPKEQMEMRTERAECWLDTELVRSAVTKGSRIFVVCESQDTSYCASALKECLASISVSSSANNAVNTIATIVSPEDGVALGGKEDSKWKSLRPQDLEGELSQPVLVRDGTQDLATVATSNNGDKDDVTCSSSSSSQARMAAASATCTSTDGLVLARQDLAEVCVQCALRLNHTAPSSVMVSHHQLRVVRVKPYATIGETDGIADSQVTERPNWDYFSMMGGEQAKAKAGVVTSVDWVLSLAPLVSLSTSDGNQGVVKEFPKRPSVS